MQRLCIILTIVAAALGGALALSVQYGERTRRECRRLESNQRTLLSDMQEYRVRDSLHAATIAVLSLRATEVEAHFAGLSALVADLGVKMRRVESVSEQALSSRYEIAAAVTDTLIRRERAELTGGTELTGEEYVRAQRIRYRDAYLDFDGTIRDGLFHGAVISYDTLTQVVHRVPRRFLFLRYGTKMLRQEIVSSNPHTRIAYSRFIRVVK